MANQPETNGASVILFGAFNPSIFQPMWFAKQGLISDAEAEQATVELVHPQVCKFTTEQFDIQVTHDRFQATTKPDVIGGPLRDLVSGTFAILEYTPIKAIGLNRLMHFPVENEGVWHGIGDALAPKAGWNTHLKGKIGLETLEVSTVDSDSSVEGLKISIILQPSKKLHPGIFFEVNYQYTADVEAGDGSREYCLGILKDRWENNQDDALAIATGLLQWANESSGQTR